jgi:hypothetical protein
VDGGFGDLDMDGRLDLSLAVFDGEVGDNLVLMHQPDGTFTEAPTLLEATAGDAGSTWAVLVMDVNEDLLPDLYEANDRGSWVRGNRMMLNVDGVSPFVDVSDETYTGQIMDGMGVAAGNFNGDSLPDIVVTNWGPNLLLESLPDGTWVRTDTVRGLHYMLPDGSDHYVPWGVVVEDLDNDGDLDVPMAVGPTSLNIPEFQPNAVFLMGPDGTFSEQGAGWGFDSTTNDRGLMTADINQAGYLDLVLRDVNGPARMYLSRCGSDHWLHVDLQNLVGERDAVGARVQVEVDGVVQTRWVFAGGFGFASAGETAVHFGLGPATVVDRLTARWPDGEETVFADVNADQRLTVVRDAL